MGTITRSFANNITSGGTFDATDLTGTIPASNIADASVTNITAVPALTAVSTVASDPPSPDAGQVWYNTTDKALRAYVFGAGSWATGGSMNTGRERFTGTGTQTSALGFGGGPPEVGLTESYDGTSWTEVADLNTVRRELAGSGADNTSALAFGGFKTPGDVKYSNTESWNGSSWTEVNDLNTARFQLAGAGTNTEALAYGGYTIPATSALTEDWNGTSWTEVADLNSSRRLVFGDGTSTSALAVGGWSPAQALTEVWNGSSWTEVNDLNTARYAGGAAAADSTTGLAFGGHNGTLQVTNTEEWDGTSWSETSDLTTARAYLGQAGVQTSALAFGGQPTTAATEEWSKTEVTTDLGVS